MLTLLDHANELSAINADMDAAVARDVLGVFNAHATDPDLSKVAHNVMPQIINQHAQAAGLITSHWYNQLDPGSKFRAKPMVDIPPEQIAKTIDWSLYAPGQEPPVSRMTGSAQRMVRGASRDTVTGNAANEGVRWARYAKPTACAFCRALAMRGSGREDRAYLYHSDKTAEFRKSDGDKYHTHCECEPVAIRGGQVWTPPDYTSEWDQQYKDAAKKLKTPRGNKDFFKHLVAQMRADEPKPAPEVNEEDAAQAVRQGALKRLQASTDIAEIENIARELLPKVSNIGFRSITGGADSDPELAKGVVRAMDDVAQKYPEVQPGAVYVAPNPVEGVFASTFQTPPTSVVRFNSRWMTDYSAYEDAVMNGIEAGFHYPGSGNPAYDTMIHELGHVMQDQGVFIDDMDVTNALTDHYVENYPNATFYDMQEWLKDNLSGYSIIANAAGHPILNADEALAEAFADTFINGDDAHETSKVLTQLLIDALAGISYSNSTRDGLPLSA